MNPDSPQPFSLIPLQGATGGVPQLPAHYPMATAPTPPHAQIISEPETASIDFGALWYGFKRFWPVAALLFLGAVGAAYRYASTATKYYEATAGTALDQEKYALVPGAVAKSEDLRALEISKGLELSLTNSSVLLKIAKKYKLHKDPILAEHRAAEGLPDDVVVWKLSERISAKSVRGTRHIDLHVLDSDPQRARDICQDLLEIATSTQSDAYSDARKKVLSELKTQEKRARQARDEAQKAVTDYRSRYPQLSLDERPTDLKTTPIEDRIKSLEVERVKAEEEAAAAAAIGRRVTAAGSSVDALLAVPGLATQETIVDLRRLRGEAAVRLSGTDYGPRHPRYKEIIQQQNNVEQALLSALQSAGQVELSKMQKTRENILRLTASIEQAKGQQNATAGVASQFSILASRLKANSDAWSAILARQNEEEANSSFNNNPLRVISTPLLPTSPSKPSKKYIMLGAAALGGMAGLASILGLMLLDRKVRTPASAERLLHIPSLGVLPRDTLKSPAQRLTSPASKHGDPTAEAFRSLRTAISLFGRSTAARSFLFTSASLSAGASYCAAHLAASFARQGFRTLLLDANLRAPTLDTLLLGSRQEHGLSTYLMGLTTEGTETCVAVKSIPNLFLFAAGTPRAHPGEILNEQAFARLLADSLKWFHRVVIDTPCVGRHPDALPLARHVDTTALVLRSGKTNRREAKRALARLTAAGARPTGFVLNEAPAKFLDEGFTLSPVTTAVPAPLALPPAAPLHV